MNKRIQKKQKDPYANPIRWEEAQNIDDDFYFFNRRVVILYDETGSDGRRRILTGELDLDVDDHDPVAIWLREEKNGALSKEFRIGKTILLDDYMDAVDEAKVKDYEEEKDGYTQETEDYLRELGSTFADAVYATLDLAPLAKCGAAADILRSFLRDLFYRYHRNEYRCIQESPLNEKYLAKMEEERKERIRELDRECRFPQKYTGTREIFETVFTEQDEFFNARGSDGQQYRMTARYNNDGCLSLWLDGEEDSTLIGEIIDLEEYEFNIYDEVHNALKENSLEEGCEERGRGNDLCQKIAQKWAAATVLKWDMSPLSVIAEGAEILKKYLEHVYTKFASKYYHDSQT